MNRPRLKIKPSRWERYVELLSMVTAFASLFYLISQYASIPEEAPVHFGLSGKPDRYGHKSILFLLPSLNICLVIGLKILSGYPHLFNYPAKITPENAEKHYRSGLRVLRYLNLFIALLLGYISFAGINTALGRTEGLNPSIMGILVGGLFLMALYHFIRGSRKS